MSATTLRVNATYQDGVLRPDEPLPLAPGERVVVVIETEDPAIPWPEDVAAVYRELAEADRCLSAAMFFTVGETWPVVEDKSWSSSKKVDMP